MKNAMKYKYNLTNAEADKKWLLINRSVNGTGRTIKFKINVVTKLRLLFGKEEKNKNGTASESASGNEEENDDNSAE
jgi:hypothetical protein